MYKVTATILLAIGIMAFNAPNLQPNEKANGNKSKNNIVFDQKDKGNKGNNANQKNEQQHGKNEQDHGQKEQNHGKKDNGNHKDIKHVSNKHDNGNKGHKNPKDYKKGHPNFDYVYVNEHGYYSHKNYGQWRSEQAKMKHKKYHPVNEYEAVEGFKLLQSRNVFLYDETDYKINLLNQRLAERRKANEIEADEYERYNTRILELQERRSGLSIDINL